MSDPTPPSSQGMSAPSGSGGPSASMSPAVQASQIPDLLRIGAIESDTSMDVETSVLEPVVHSDTFCRFVLQNKGILHSHSKIAFALDLSGTDAKQCSLPTSTGIYALIQNARLKIGGKTLCEIDDFGQFMSYKSMFINNEAMKEREQYTTGRQMSYRTNYKNREKSATAKYQFGWEGSNQRGDGLTIDNFMEPCVSTASTEPAKSPNVVEPFTPTPFYLQLSKQVEADVPTFQMSLADLFPFLRTNQLPLYMMKEEVSLELTFSQAGTNSVAVSAQTSSERVIANTTNGQQAKILTTETRMIADYIYYPQEMMAAYAAANQKLQFTFADYRLSKFSIKGGTLPSQQIRNVGGAGRVISKVFFGLQNNARNQKSMLNVYGAEAPARDYVGAGAGTFPDATKINSKSTINLKYNDNFLYPIDVSNSSRHFHNVNQAEGIVPFVTREVYGREGVSLTGENFGVNGEDGAGGGTPNHFRISGKNELTKLLQEAPETNNLSGQMNFYAMRLNRGERVNSRGVELYFKFARMPGSNEAGAEATFIQRAWLETMKVAELEGGVLTSYWA